MVGGPSTLNKMDPWEEFLLFSVILPMANAEQTRNQHRQEAACEARLPTLDCGPLLQGVACQAGPQRQRVICPSFAILSSA
jgi:hypothetical protein